MIKIATDFIFRSHLFKPTYLAKSFLQVQQYANKEDIKLIIFDKDDTLTPLHSFTITNPIVIHTLQLLEAKDIKMCILSNSIKPNDPKSIGNLTILRTKQKKPYNLSEVIEIIKPFNLNEVMIVGDRLLTDIYLSNLIGCKSILVPQLQQTTKSKHGHLVLILRMIEKHYININSWK